MDILEQWVSDFLLLWVLPILLYSGAMLPLGVALLLHKKMEERRRKHQRLFFILFWVQAASFLPFILALLLRVPHAIHGLI